MRGRQILVEPRTGGHAAALMVDGRLEDLLVDPDPTDTTPRPEAIYRATVGRPMKGMGGAFVELDRGATGFLRGARLPAPGARALVQVSAWAEPGKAPPVSTRLRLKGRTALLTPGAPGRNVARSIRDPEIRAGLEELAAQALAAPELGLILRTAAAEADRGEVADEIAALLGAFRALEAGSEPGLLRPAPGAAAVARRDWWAPGDAWLEDPDAFATHDLWQEVEALSAAPVPLRDGDMRIEPTRALVAVDVNTAGASSPAAALKANLAAVRELPRQLRLRGLGGQIAIDFAPLAKADRPKVEAALTAALRADGIDTALAGWTPLGHLELNRKRARRPLP